MNFPHKYILRIAVFVSLLVIADQLIGFGLRQLYFRQQSGFQYRAMYAIQKSTEDLLVFGASTATHHFVPHYFNDSLGVSFYNAGRDGSGIFYHYAMFSSILKRHAPKAILLDVHPDVFMTDQQDYDRLSELLPYYRNYPEMREIINYRSAFEPAKHWSAIYPFNSDLLSIIMGNLSVNKSRKADNQGYVALHRTMKPQPVDSLVNPARYTIDSLKVKVFVRFIEEAKRKHIKLYVVRSPKYVFLDNASTRLLSELTKKYEIPYIDYSYDKEFINNPSLFDDFAHLNDAGARLFSRRVVEDIRPLLSGTISDTILSADN